MAESGSFHPVDISILDLLKWIVWHGTSWRCYKTAQFSLTLCYFTCRTDYHICSGMFWLRYRRSCFKWL